MPFKLNNKNFNNQIVFNKIRFKFNNKNFNNQIVLDKMRFKFNNGDSCY